MNNEQLAALQAEIQFYNEQTDELLSQLELLTTPRTTRRIYELVAQAGRLNYLRLKMLETGVCEYFWRDVDALVAQTRQFRLDIYAAVPFIIRMEGDEANAKLLQTMAENMYKCCANVAQFKMKFGADIAAQKSYQREVTRSPSAYSALRANSRNGTFYQQNQQNQQQYISDYQPEPINWQVQKAAPYPQQMPVPQQMQLTRNEYPPQREQTEQRQPPTCAPDKCDKLEKEIGMIKSRLYKLEYLSYAKTQLDVTAQAQDLQKTSLANVLAGATAYDIVMALDAQKKQDLLMLLLSEQ